MLSNESRSCTLVQPPVVEVKRVRPRTFSLYYGDKYKNPLAKGVFFLVREGPPATLRKFRSKVLERRIEGEHAVVIGLIHVEACKYVGFTRYCGEPYVFPTSLVYRLGEGKSLDAITLSDEALRLLESYLPVPSCPVPEGLPTLLSTLNPFLQHVDDDTFLRRFRATSRSSTRPQRQATNGTAPRDKAQVYFLGFGAYVREYVLPHFKDRVAAAVDYKARLIQKHYSASFPIYSSVEDVLGQIAVAARPLIIVATYHSDHALIALESLHANPNARVFIEKPVAVELSDTRQLVEEIVKGAWIDVGYNRRYARLTRVAKEHLGGLSRPLVITALVKELKIPNTHWYFWSNQGTRMTGNACHWIDLAMHFADSLPTEINLLNSGDSVALGILFQDGTLASIVLSDRGDDLRGVDESIEIRGGKTTISIRDFHELQIRSEGHTKRVASLRRDKGHGAMYTDLRQRWLSGMQPNYPLRDLFWVSYITYQASLMLKSGRRNHKVDLAGLAHEASYPNAT